LTFVKLQSTLSTFCFANCKISVSFQHIPNFEVLNLAMVKVKKVNIAVTYCLAHFQTGLIFAGEGFEPTLKEESHKWLKSGKLQL
jgi:hypothetical protein